MYQVDEECRKNVWKYFEKNEELVKEDVDKIKKWLETQTHIPQKMDSVEITNFLQLNKFNIEKTKEKISNYYTLRTKITEIFSNNNPKLPKMQQVFDTAYVFTHPELLEGLHRALIIKMKEPNTYIAYDMIKTYLNIFEVRLREDCMFDDICIMDMATMTFKDVLKFTPKVCYNVVSVYKNVFSFRLKALIFLNSPLYISVWIQTLKFLLPKKLVDRIQVYRDAEVMKELFPKEVLPEEYGGEGPTMGEFNDMMKRKLSENQDLFDKLDRLNEQMKTKKTTIVEN